MKECLFKCGYTLYAKTSVGRFAHNRILAYFKKHNGEKVHTRLTPMVFNEGLMVLPFPYLCNNYTYLVADLFYKDFVLIDVGDAASVKSLEICPDAILTTHRHWDHCGGNKAMKKAYPDLKIYGGEKEKVPNHTVKVKDGEVISFGRLKFTAIWTPGHTAGHIVWKLDGQPFNTVDSVFTGDLIMMACCGANFEGSKETMIASLNMMMELPDDTWVWPGHEMALSALESSVFMEPTNMNAIRKLCWVVERRQQLLCTCPSTLGEEKSYNPFLRTHEESLLKCLGMEDHIEKIATDPMAVSVECFERIIARCELMSRMKKEIRETRKEAGEKKLKEEAGLNKSAKRQSGTASKKNTMSPAVSVRKGLNDMGANSKNGKNQVQDQDDSAGSRPTISTATTKPSADGTHSSNVDISTPTSEAGRNVDIHRLIGNIPSYLQGAVQKSP